MQKGVAAKNHSVNNEWFILYIKWRMYTLQNNQLGLKLEVDNQHELIWEIYEWYRQMEIDIHAYNIINKVIIVYLKVNKRLHDNLY